MKNAFISALSKYGKADPAMPIPVKEIKYGERVTYDCSFYKSGYLQQWGKAYAHALPHDATFLLSASTSSAAIATAIMMLKDNLRHAHIHPEATVSHRGKEKRISGLIPVPDDVIVFVDDFVDSGRTCYKAITSFLKEMDGHKSYYKLSYILLGHLSPAAQKLADIFEVPVHFANGLEELFPHPLGKKEKDLLIEKFLA